MNNILNSYLTYLDEATKWKEKVSSGEVSSAGVQKLRQSGNVKPWAQYKKGFEKGTANIMKKAGATTGSKYHPYHKIAQKYGPITIPTIIRAKPKVHMGTPRTTMNAFRSAEIKGKLRQHKGSEPLLKRHEADETRELQKQKQKYGRSGMGGIAMASPAGKTAGHASLNVLKKEKKYLPFASKVYGQGKPLQKLRKISGEYDLADKYSGRQVRKMDAKAGAERVKARGIATAKTKEELGLSGPGKAKKLWNAIKNPRGTVWKASQRRAQAGHYTHPTEESFSIPNCLEDIWRK